ncbi:MAG: putative Zn finger-like uncharacterized protein [Candidatus Krumholzibacteriia bacterium]|jgi:predicted Zn finger-like uncharacterized protein
MITTCTECQARYQLDDEKIPARVIKVRCPACSGVFELDGTKAGQPAAATTESPLVTSNAFGNADLPKPDQAPAVPVAATPEPVPTPRAQAPAAAVAEPASSVAVMDEPAFSAPKKGRRRRGKEEMLARALVSDIMVYNKDLYETAKAENNLLEALGAEIKKSWELYKQKVTPEVANSTDHFRNALNEILADGEKVF